MSSDEQLDDDREERAPRRQACGQGSTGPARSDDSLAQDWRNKRFAAGELGRKRGGSCPLPTTLTPCTTLGDIDVAYAILSRPGHLCNRHVQRIHGLTMVSDRFEDLVKTAELPPIRLHDCRHTAASLMLASGVPMNVVSELLGHSSPTITLSISAHVIPGMAEESGAAPSASRLGRPQSATSPVWHAWRRGPRAWRHVESGFSFRF